MTEQMVGLARETAADLAEQGVDGAGNLLCEMASTIEALQQRCEELEAECKRAWSTADHVLNNNPDLKPRVAALEAGVDKALIQISGGLCYYTAEAKHAQLRDAQKTLQALTSSEGAGGCPHGCVDGWILVPDCIRPKRESCPLHGDHHGKED